MSAYTTLYISRDKARKTLRERVNQLSDSQLEEFLNQLTEPTLHRVSIDGEFQGRNDRQLERALP
jgi:hypothetical protein